MSVFSFIRKGRQAAKEHKAEKEKKEKEEAQKPPYKHIPRHAAIDAISGGPAGWKTEDRQKIVDENKRRSTMTANGLNMPSMISVHHGLPRVHSALSHVSYPSAYASPHVAMPRTYSYSSMPAGWAHPLGDVYTPMEMPGTSLKGKEVERVMNDPYRANRSSSKLSVGRYSVPMNAIVGTGDVSVSPVDSSSNSTSSREDLEMKPTKHTSMPPSTSATRNFQASRPTSANGSIHRLHPARRLSDAEQAGATTPPAVPSPVRASFAPRISSLPAGIPPVPSIPPMQFGTAMTAPTAVNSAASSITMVPVASTTSLSAKMPGVAIPNTPGEEDTHEIYFTPEPSSDEETSPVGTAITFPTATSTPPRSPGKTGRRSTSKYTRFTELTTINSNISATVETSSPQLTLREVKTAPEQTIAEIDETRRPTSTIAHTLPINFDEGSLPAPKELDLPAPAPKKLSKASGGKLSKKPRWSLRSNKNSAVAV
ncbi:hypothetical protein QBC35DRAFT_8272 [Podospora australis]|uniref:Uncharacterized protein n=1 Tax=Podospora australis TaxID=1536484 RepID=A0AAN7AP35_9PEZI|nr:hypothetical protein QBC35DRAFT_8272 [Podospora australis]